MAGDPDEYEAEYVPDEEAPADADVQEPPLAVAPTVGVDLPEADVLDQWRDVGTDDEDEAR